MRSPGKPSSLRVRWAPMKEALIYNHCGAYRPQFNCRMRALGDPYCARVSAELSDKPLDPSWPAGPMGYKYHCCGTDATLRLAFMGRLSWSPVDWHPVSDDPEAELDCRTRPVCRKTRMARPCTGSRSAITARGAGYIPLPRKHAVRLARRQKSGDKAPSADWFQMLRVEAPAPDSRVISSRISCE